MRDPVTYAKSLVREMTSHAVGQAIASGALPEAEIPDYVVEIPNETMHGDFAVNVALVGARVFRQSPRAVAESVVKNMQLHPLFSDVQVAGPGFINFFLGQSYYSETIAEILKSGQAYGRTDHGGGDRVMVEFVSANPTGPMHLGNARGGALGDCIAALLNAAGYSVSREFYVNDAGNQIDKFGLSLEARYLQLYRDDIVFPEDGYHGDDITEHAKAFAAQYGDGYAELPAEARREALVAFALPKNIEAMQQVLHDYRIDYDTWFFESTLHKDGTVQKVMDLLTARGYTYEQDGALWYRATDFGAEKDEVLVKSNGFFTYFAVDIAYHYNKFVRREFDRVINVWGADHHGHVARMKGALDALGIGGNRLDVVLMQLVNLVRDGEPVRMSKRTGKAITLTDLLEEIPLDAARFYFVMREYTSHFDFDLGLAVKKDKENPVYYVQYAHARICSILREVAARTNEDADDADLFLLDTEPERSLIRQLSLLPSEIVAAAAECEPARITRNAIDVATAFHKFYEHCRVLCDDADLRRARIALCTATRQVLGNVLALLKVQAPETMEQLAL